MGDSLPYLDNLLPSTIKLRAAEEKQNGFCRYIFTNKVTFWAASYSACMVYTKTIIHLSVGESGGYLPPLQGIIVKYLRQLQMVFFLAKITQNVVTSLL